MQNYSQLTIENFGKKVSANVSSITLCIFIYIWTANFSQQYIDTKLINITIFLIISFGIIQIRGFKEIKTNEDNFQKKK
ncbi:MAG: hypothetical protein CBD16_05735, partial [Betaproteobacteria bacterium TMED156]